MFSRHFVSKDLNLRASIPVGDRNRVRGIEQTCLTVFEKFHTCYTLEWNLVYRYTVSGN
jgi:hypothetical protein